ncbi:GNAT family N-acetyltransferase [Actinoplanes sp. N902-109]|uniref:GNAT family N-acetyltransferase n=1 Tax=Actinoplanes sp. (strain N902-109) TaxID=649831 RepID=UPI0003293AA3|nr:acetyltransferase [Actinoplanes sp. N902-109]
MTTARPATAEDAPELIRLRAVMLRSMGDAVPDGPWQQTGLELLRTGLGDTLAAFVVDRPAGPGLAACAVGAVDQRLPGPSNPTGLRGYVYNVATDPEYRRRGYSRACMTALIDWYAGRGIRGIDLRASPDGLPLYESLGFRRTADPAMRLTLT